MESGQRMVIAGIISIAQSTTKDHGVKKNKSAVYAFVFRSGFIAYHLSLLSEPGKLVSGQAMLTVNPDKPNTIEC